MIESKSGYMTEAFRSPVTLARRARVALVDVDYDTLVGRGLSGALVVPDLARRLKKHWLIVRKPQEGSHTYRKAEGELGERWIFVDDFIETGDTLAATQQAVAQLIENAYRPKPRTFVGSYLYNNDVWRPAPGVATRART